MNELAHVAKLGALNDDTHHAVLLLEPIRHNECVALETTRIAHRRGLVQVEGGLGHGVVAEAQWESRD